MRSDQLRSFVCNCSLCFANDFHNLFIPVGLNLNSSNFHINNKQYGWIRSQRTAELLSLVFSKNHVTLEQIIINNNDKHVLKIIYCESLVTISFSGFGFFLLFSWD